MIKLIANLAIRSKLLLSLLLPSTVSLIFTGAILFTLETNEFRKNIRDDLSSITLLIANRSVSALMFNDEKLASENLAAFASIPEVEVACLYDADNELFSKLIKNSHTLWQCPSSPLANTTHFQGNHLCVVQPILFDNKQEGTLYVHAELAGTYARKIQFVGILLLVLISSTILAFFLSTPLLRFVTTPLKKIMVTVKTISINKDYSLRASKTYNDELGILVDALNDLLTTVEKQNLAITRSKDHYMALFDDNPTMIFNIKADGTILSLNRTAIKELNLNHLDWHENKVFDFIHPLDLPVMEAFITRCLSVPTQTHKQELRQISYSGRVIWVKATAKNIIDEQQECSLLMVCENVTEARQLAERIAYQASHDALTGLANRSEFDRRISDVIMVAHGNNSEHALCYLDLDQFKIINDTCGHLAGDELLRQLSDALKKNIRSNDFVARLGGDEFGILMYNCSLLEASQVCEQLRDLIKEMHFVWDERNFGIAVSIGVTAINASSGSAIHLLKEADAACYAAKDKGRNRVHVFRPDDEQLVLRHGEMQWVTRIQQGIEQNSFCLYGQPIVSLNNSEQGLHFETLVRYQSAHGTPIIPPGAFLPAAERYNLAPDLDRWIISHLFEWLAHNPEFLRSLSLCSVNLSGLSLSDETMLKFITKQLSQWRIPAQKICFEITETAAISNLTSATKFMHKLKSQGCQFSLDDFGCGLSSFAYLRSLPIDYLKIDGLFIKDIVNDNVDRAMVNSINQIGHIMGKKTIAEFVENQQILNLLRELGIDYAQGYGISEPVPLHELKNFIYPMKNK